MNFQEACFSAAHLIHALPEVWTRHAYSRDSSGKVMSPDAPTACCWCAFGMVREALKRSLTPEECHTLDRAGTQLGMSNGILSVNDVSGRLAAADVLMKASTMKVEWQY